jgi:hypothetical protein
MISGNYNREYKLGQLNNLENKDTHGVEEEVETSRCP